MLKNTSPQNFTMEVTVISAEGLKKTSSSVSALFFSRRLRPFVTLTLPPFSCSTTTTTNTNTNGDKLSHVYKTRIDDQGGINPTWGDKFHIPITDSTFFHQRHYSFIYLQLYNKHVMLGQTQLGWCQIPAADILDGLSPAGTVRRLSYRLRSRDGSRAHGVVNVAVKLEGSVSLMRQENRDLTQSPEMGLCQPVLGIPVAMSPADSVERLSFVRLPRNLWSQLMDDNSAKIPTSTNLLLLTPKLSTSSSSVPGTVDAGKTLTLINFSGYRDKVVHGHEAWRLITCIWLHAGVIHLLANMLSLVFIGTRLEQQFGFVGAIYLLSGFGESILSAPFIQHRISCGASGALFGLPGAMLSELLTNWTIYTNKAAALFSLVIIIVINLAVGILPYVDNFAHIGGFLTGFLLGFLLLLHPQFGWPEHQHLQADARVKSKHTIFKYVLLVVSLVLLIVGTGNAFQRGEWKRSLQLVPPMLANSRKYKTNQAASEVRLYRNHCPFANVSRGCSGSGIGPPAAHYLLRRHDGVLARINGVVGGGVFCSCAVPFSMGFDEAPSSLRRLRHQSRREGSFFRPKRPRNHFAALPINQWCQRKRSGEVRLE
ncbi:RHOMBOID-like protein 2 [Camellia lanceoleosa]|uniref:RHOMBOID-like protein 2 n=1 Tax=Camellia lanceoleosa TaxID=1840588 RepID=A0ACC0FKL3_9ERIC|nr:RHOMBOID-like protein 2 [Camellia lanceoleosa]